MGAVLVMRRDGSPGRDGGRVMGRREMKVIWSSSYFEKLGIMKEEVMVGRE